MKKDILRTTSKSSHTVADRDTGEVISQTEERNEILVNKDKTFYLMYASMLHVLKTKFVNPEIVLYAGLIQMYGRSQVFTFTKTVRELIAKDAQCSPASFDRAIVNLVKKDLIVKLSPREYQVNPKYVFQGSRNDRDKEVRVMLKKQRDGN